MGRHSIYVWKSRAFEEMIYMHIPRFMFLAASCYVIYQINLRQQRNKQWRHGVQSNRQQEITKQIDEIAAVIGVNEPNQFEPLKKVEYDKSYSGDQFQYQYQLEEKELQDKLFKMYDELQDEEEEEDQ